MIQTAKKCISYYVTQFTKVLKKTDMNKIKLNIGFGLVVATIIGIVPLPGLTAQLKSENFHQLTKQNNRDFLTYNNSENNLSIRYPDNWIKKEEENGVMFISPKENSEDIFQENIGVTVQTLANSTVTLEQITAASLEQLKNMITDFSLVSSTQINLANMPAKKLIYTGKFGNFNIKWLQVIALEKDKFYIITYTAEASTYNNALNLVEEMIDSFNKK